jgi:hypothetical protein
MSWGKVKHFAESSIYLFAFIIGHGMSPPGRMKYHEAEDGLSRAIVDRNMHQLSKEETHFFSPSPHSRN